VLLAQRSNGSGGFRGLAGMRINGVGGDQFACAINHRDFHAGTQARVETHGRAQARRCSHQQVMQVTGKNVNRFVFSAFAHGAH